MPLVENPPKTVITDFVKLDIVADYDPAAATEIMLMDDAEVNDTLDTSRKRIQVLVAVIRNAIFKHHSETITEDIIKELCADITTKELETCLLICTLTMPYVPSKKNWYSMPHQLPFVLMANDILRASGYNKFTISVCPLTMPGKLNALAIDAPSLFSLFCSPKLKKSVTKLDIYDFGGRKIVSREVATENKDAVFGSFFNIQQIQAIAGSYGQFFNHRMTLLPGLKTVRLSGILKRPAISNTNNSVKSKKTKDATLPTRDTGDDLDTLRGIINTLYERLKEFYKKRKNTLLENQLYLLKKEWKDAEDQNLLYNQIKDEKQRRRLLNKEIAHTKSELQKRRQELHQLRNPNKEPTEMTKSYTITQENSCCLENAERVSLSDEILYSKNTFFGGTDNGLVNMTETASFDINRFKNHIELYNYYSVLENDGM